jgi:hypothetical protein
MQLEVMGKRLALVAAPALLVLVAYGRVLQYPFVYDDLSGILDDSLVNRAITTARLFMRGSSPGGRRRDSVTR